MSELINEATLTVNDYTGKTDDGHNSDSPDEPSHKKGSLRSRIKIKVIGAGRYGGDKVQMTGSEEDLISYAKRHLGGEGDTLAQVSSTVNMGESFSITKKLEENIATYLEEGSCGSVHASYKKGKKLHATYSEEGDYQEFFKGVLTKFGVESPDELSDDKKKEFFEYIDANWEGDNEKAEDTAAADSLVPNGEKKKKDLD